MRLFKVIVISVTLALIVYFVFTWFRNRKTFVSPLPEEGIKIIEVQPTE